MILGHAFDAWVTPAGKETLAYAVKRFTGTFPLPTFLLVAGVAVAWRVDAAARRGEAAAAVRRGVVRRGLLLVATGYAVNLVYAAIDGLARPASILRVDVLHVIGLSIAVVGALGIRPAGAAGAAAPPSPARLARAAAAVAAAVTLLCPWLTGLTRGLHGPLAAPLALLVEVDDPDVMPFVPLAAWLGAGVLAGGAMLAGRRRVTGELPRAGTSSRTLVTLGAVGVALAAAGAVLAPVMLDAWPGPFDRRHPAVVANVFDLGGRALALVAAAAALSNHLGGLPRAALLALGRGSLVAYVFHLPLTYGRLGAPLHGRLEVGEAFAGVLVLWALSLAAVVAWARTRTVLAAARPPRPATGVS